MGSPPPHAAAFRASPDTLVRYLDWARRNAAGETVTAIAASEGINKSSVSKGITEAHRHVDDHTKAVMRGTILTGHMRAMGRLWDIVDAKHPVVSNGKLFDNLEDSTPVIAALREWRGQAERLARLLGLDAVVESRSIIEGEVVHRDDRPRTLDEFMDELAARRARRALGGGESERASGDGTAREG